MRGFMIIAYWRNCVLGLPLGSARALACSRCSVCWLSGYAFFGVGRTAGLAQVPGGLGAPSLVPSMDFIDCVLPLEGVWRQAVLLVWFTPVCLVPSWVSGPLVHQLPRSSDLLPFSMGHRIMDSGRQSMWICIFLIILYSMTKMLPFPSVIVF